jgi:hypothetical protein
VLKTVLESRVTAERYVKENAADWAEMTSKSALDAVPEMRVKLQDVLLDSIDSAFKEGTKASGDVFAEFLKKNNSLVREGIIKLSGKPEDAAAFIADVSLAMQEELGGDLRHSLQQVIAWVKGTTATLQKTKPDGPLPPRLAAKREFFRLVKRWCVDEAPPPAPGSTKA